MSVAMMMRCTGKWSRRKLDQKISSVNWKKLMGKSYAQAEKQAIEVAA